MSRRLLDRQVELVEYLTSSAAIFDDAGDAPIAVPHGLHRGRLHLEARFSHQKRMEKIAGVLPRTFALMGARRAVIGRDFAAACPPTDISRLSNARQFQAFLGPWWRRRKARPACVPDVAACETACAAVRAYRDSGEPAGRDSPAGAVRRARGAVLLRCRYDVRPLFETGGARDGAGDVRPAARDTPLAVAAGPDAEPRIFELSPAVFALLATLDDWTDAAPFTATPQSASLLRMLRQSGLVEAGR